jgi:hypothetical protein
MSNDNIAPRGLSREAAAAYCGCETLSAFDSWVRKGIVPGAIPGTRIWDRKSIDYHLDVASSLFLKKAQANDNKPDPLKEWQAKRACKS